MKRFYRRLGTFIENKRLVVIMLAVVLLVASILGATRLTWATGTDTMISADSQVYKDFQEFNRYFGNETLIVLVKGEATSQLVKLQNVQAMDGIEQRMSSADGVLSVVGPGFALRQAMAQMGGAAVLP